MNPPGDRYPEILRNVAEAYLAGGVEAGRILLAPIASEVWPGLPRREVTPRRSATQAPMTLGRRTFSAARSAATFQRDHFRCRYCGCETIPKPIAVLLHSVYPRELPFHEHYKAGCMHPVFWTRVPEADHLETGGMPLLVVRLGDGTTVRATVGGGSVPVLPGRAVLLSATGTKLFGISKYRFVSYLEQPSTEGRSNMPLQPTPAAGLSEQPDTAGEAGAAERQR